MDAERWKRVDELLQTAPQVPVERQEEFLRQQCAAAIPNCWRKSGRSLLLAALRPNQNKIHATPLSPGVHSTETAPFLLPPNRFSGRSP
jgi:hypothetical protein